MSLGELSEHRLYWADSVKIDRYRRALATLITPDSTVLDLGCGTGLLGLLAVRLGARHVYAVDSGSILALAKEIAEANGAADRITHIQAMSTSVELPEQVDIVVADQLGGLGYEPGVLAYYADARRRLVKPDGAFVPERLRLLLAPVQCAEVSKEVDFWRTRPGDFDVSAAAPYVANDVHSPNLGRDDLLAAPVVVRDQPTWINESFTVEASFTIERDGVLRAIAGMFDAVMTDGISMSNNPCSADHMDHRWNSVYPLARAGRGARRRHGGRDDRRRRRRRACHVAGDDRRRRRPTCLQHVDVLRLVPHARRRRAACRRPTCRRSAPRVRCGGSGSRWWRRV